MHKTSAEQEQRVLELEQEGKVQREIAAQLGMPRSTVGVILKRMAEHRTPLATDGRISAYQASKDHGLKLKTLYEAIDSEMVADELGNIGSVTVRGKKNYYSVDAARFSAWVESRRGRTCTYPGCDAEALLLSERCMKHTGAVTLLGTTFDAERRARMAAAKEFMSRPDVAERYRHDWEKGGPLTLGLFYGREGELKPYFKPETRERHLPKWAKAIAEARGKKVGPAFTKVDADVARRILKAKDEGKSERQIVYIIGSLFDLKLSKTAVHNVIANRAEVIDHFLLHESV